jgi:hypothetical protein
MTLRSLLHGSTYEAEKVWPDFGITMHHDDGKAILTACKKRRLELKGLPPKDMRAA